MKYITQFLCALAFAIAGISLAVSEKDSKGYNHPTISAATVQQYNFPQLPLNVKPDADKKYNKPDTVFIDNYTVELPPRPERIVTKVKRIYLPAPTQEDSTVVDRGLITPDKIPIDTVKNKVGAVREENTADKGSPETSIILVVDGEEVYKR